MAVKMSPPIFIGGLFKSGTSLLRAMLGQHSSIASGLESYWFDLDWKGPRDKEFQDHIDRLIHFYDMDHTSMESLVSRSTSSLNFLDHFMSAYADKDGKKRWAEKTPGNILYLDRIYDEFPDAKVIHIVRDPKDVFASLRQAGKWDSINEFADMWSLFFGTAARLEKELDLDSDRFITIRYENLVVRPAHTMRFVTDFLEEEWEDSISQFSGKVDEYEKVLSITGKASTTLDRLRKPISDKRIGIWRSVLREEEIEAVREGIRKKGLLSSFLKIERETTLLLDNITQEM